ncbi:MAG: TIGR04282 family arsenosugar biosynthesis glycosyltransferase [Balneolaceae bacterium]
MPKNKLIIFVKNEEIGKVKTRLAESIGDAQALKIYRQLLRHTHEQASRTNATKEVWYSNFITENDLWDSGNFTKKKQSGSDLGARMSGAFRESLQLKKAQNVVLIGSDCPGLTAEIINNAFRQLSGKNIVIGPALDGGYYLIGMSSYFPELFENMVWSTDSVLEDTVEIIRKTGASFALLEELNDVDTAEDLEWMDK